MNLWQNLLRFWPVTFADTIVAPAGVLQAHGGNTSPCTPHATVSITAATYQEPSGGEFLHKGSQQFSGTDLMQYHNVAASFATKSRRNQLYNNKTSCTIMQ